MIDLDRLYLRPREVADELGLTPSAVYRMAREGRLPCVRIGRTVRIPSDAFKAWRSANEGQGLPIVRLGGGELGEPSSPGRGWTLADRQASFEERAGCTVDEYLAKWKASDVPETAENEELALEALGLRIAGLKKSDSSAREELEEPSVA